MHSGAAEQLALDDERDEQVAIAVLVEEHRQLVAVVALDGPLAPPLAPDALADRERLGGWRLVDPGGQVVVAVAAPAGVVLAEVREQERAAAALVLGVAAHHVQPRALDLVLALRLRFGGRDSGVDADRAGPANIAVCVPL